MPKINDFQFKFNFPKFLSQIKNFILSLNNIFILDRLYPIVIHLPYVG